MIALALVAIVVLAAFWWAEEDPRPAELPAPREARVDVLDGPERENRVQLDVTLHAPAETPAPAVLLAHGFGADKTSVADQARELARRGFTVLTYSARGFGASTGRIALNHPDYEVADARQLVDWLARQPEVLRDDDNDPRIGVTGTSYGGALALSLAGTDPRVDALAPVMAYNDLAAALLPNRASAAPLDRSTPAAASGTSTPGVLKQAWAGLLFSAGGEPTPQSRSGGAGGPAGQRSSALTCGRLAPAVCRAYTRIARTGEADPAARALLERASPKRFTDRIHAPTLLVQGEQDTLFGLDQADANARQIARAGGEVRVLWYAGGHGGGAPDAEVRRRIGDWFAARLGGVDPPEEPIPAFRYDLAGRPQRDGHRAERTVVAPEYPGMREGRTARFDIGLRGEPARVVNPPGGTPAATSTLPGTRGARTPARDLPEQTAVFRSEPLRKPLLISGVPQTRLSVSAVPGQPGGDEAVLFAKLYDVGPGGERTMVGDAVAPLRITGLPQDGSPVDVHVALPGVVHSVEPGHRLELAVTTTDRAFTTSREPAVHRVGLAGGGALSAPSVRGTDLSAGSVPVAPLTGIGVIIAAAALVWGVSRIRRRGDGAVAELTDTPLAIDRLSKSHAGTAGGVRELSLRVERGQIVGLLGPNGAGKTTTLRMLLGLVHPDAGTVRIFGHLARPGAPVLSRVGALVENPGFLPHLSGIDNLRSYWAATSRPILQARFDEVLRIAGLDEIAHSPVRTYSQGMRQRLAIAQAMLGLPDLLVLDEPVNGLDPPQIQQLREMLHRYAATGRSVLISSHLLSEVERTCTHVVVMHQGRLVTSGGVSEVVGSGDELSIRVDDPAAAAEALRAITGIGLVRRDTADGQVHVDLGSVSAGIVVNALVAAEVAVHQVGPRRRLEDAFLQLVGEEQ
ncbi:alpha/beta fold hydrolase [Salinifilum aidingensis]